MCTSEHEANDSIELPPEAVDTVCSPIQSLEAAIDEIKSSDVALVGSDQHLYLADMEEGTISSANADDSERRQQRSLNRFAIGPGCDLTATEDEKQLRRAAEALRRQKLRMAFVIGLFVVLLMIFISVVWVLFSCNRTNFSSTLIN